MGLAEDSLPRAGAALLRCLYALSFQCQNFLFGTVLVSLDFTCHQQQSTKCDKMFGICCFMHQQLESAKCVCYDLTPTKTHPYRRLPVNFNLLLLQQITLYFHKYDWLCHLATFFVPINYYIKVAKWQSQSYLWKYAIILCVIQGVTNIW